MIPKLAGRKFLACNAEVKCCGAFEPRGVRAERVADRPRFIDESFYRVLVRKGDDRSNRQCSNSLRYFDAVPDFTLLQKVGDPLLRAARLSTATDKIFKRTPFYAERLGQIGNGDPSRLDRSLYFLFG